MKNRKKKNLAMALTVFTVFASVLTGCNNTAKETANTTSGTQESNATAAAGGSVTITNVSYDPTRELYASYNEIFAEHYKEETGIDVTVEQSHGGSGSQARSVVEGTEADVVTLALAHDITTIEDAGMIEEGWIDEFDRNSSPYTSTIVFLVRSGNEKDIQDWDDLIKDGVEVITPDPKSSGGACWNFLAAWAYAGNLYNNQEDQQKEFMSKLYSNVSVMDSGARAATTTFVENGQGDVLIAWENEALLSVEEHPDEYEIITPSISILAEPSVAIVDSVVDDHGTRDVAKAYLEYLYSDDAQRLAGENFYRPTNETILQEFSDTFNLDINLVTIDDFGGWDQAYDDFFVDGAIFDEIYEN